MNYTMSPEFTAPNYKEVRAESEIKDTDEENSLSHIYIYLTDAKSQVMECSTRAK